MYFGLPNFNKMDSWPYDDSAPHSQHPCFCLEQSLATESQHPVSVIVVYGQKKKITGYNKINNIHNIC